MSFLHRFPVASRLALLVAVSGALLPLSYGQSQVMSLDEALQRAEEANIALKLSRESAQQAAGLAQQQRVALLPNISLSGQQRRSESVTITDGSPVPSAPGNRFDGKLVGSLTVLNPQQISAYKAARKGAQAAELEVLNSQQGALASVSQAFFTHLRNLRRLDVLDSNIKRAESLLVLSKNQASAGVATQIDVTRAESQLALAEQARLQHSTTLVSSELAVQRLLELPLDKALSLKVTALKRVASSKGDVSELRGWRERRSDYQKALVSVEQARLELRSARWQRLPSVGLNGEYGRVAAKFGDSDTKEAWLASASVSLPIFDGLKASADTRVALSRQRAQELRLQQLATQIDAELRFAQQDSDSRDAQIKVAQTSLRLAEEELRLARIRFEQGVADNREVVEAQNRLAVAADGLVEAEYMYNLARVELARARGDTRAILKEVE